LASSLIGSNPMREHIGHEGSLRHFFFYFVKDLTISSSLPRIHFKIGLSGAKDAPNIGTYMGLRGRCMPKVSSNNIYPLPWTKKKEAVSDHGGVEALRLGRKPAGNLLIDFGIHVSQLYGRTEKENLLCQRRVL